MIADAGTPWRREMLSTVSPAATVTGVPPSQVQWPLGAGLGAATTDPVTSWVGVGARPGLPGAYEAMPRPPPAMPVPAATVSGLLADGGGAACAVAGGSGLLSTRPAGAGCADGIEAVVSTLAFGLSLKRNDSALHPAMPTVINVSAAARGHDHGRNTSAREGMAYSLIRNTQAELTPLR